MECLQLSVKTQRSVHQISSTLKFCLPKPNPYHLISYLFLFLLPSLPGILTNYSLYTRYSWVPLRVRMLSVCAMQWERQTKGEIMRKSVSRNPFWKSKSDCKDAVHLCWWENGRKLYIKQSWADIKEMWHLNNLPQNTKMFNISSNF